MKLSMILIASLCVLQACVVNGPAESEPAACAHGEVQVPVPLSQLTPYVREELSDCLQADAELWCCPGEKPDSDEPATKLN